MQVHPSQLAKSTSNTHLLSLLTRRSAKSIPSMSAHGGWPGKHAPSLANILVRRNDHKSVKLQRREANNASSHFTRARRSNQKMIKTVPLVKMGSTSLSLLPSSRSKVISVHSTWRSTRNKFFTSEHLPAKNNQLEFKNSRVCEVINNQNLEDYKKKSILELVNKFQQQVDSNSKAAPKQKTVLNDYVIDYKTFNYIDKVIDNPQKWHKFVHKKTPFNPSSHFITATQSQPKRSFRQANAQ